MTDTYGVITLTVLNDGTDEIFHLHGSATTVTEKTTVKSLLEELYFQQWAWEGCGVLEDNIADNDDINTIEEAKEHELNYRSYFVLFHPTTSEESAYQSIKWMLDTQNDDNVIVLPSEQFISGTALRHCLTEILENLGLVNPNDKWKEAVAKQVCTNGTIEGYQN